MVSKLFSQPSGQSGNEPHGSITKLEPTPIDPHGVIPVESFSLRASPLLTDATLMSSIQNILLNPLNNGRLQENTGSEVIFSEELNGLLQTPYIFPGAFAGGAQLPEKKAIVEDTASPPPSRSSTPERITSFENSSCFRSAHLEQWNQRYKELAQFQKEFGHCMVPLNWPENPSLAHWIKRQRHQYRMKKEGKHSTLTSERQETLEKLGFVWDSHAAGWEERWKELRHFREEFGHCRVPKKYEPNPQLAIWVKCQRRQYKLYCENKVSNMTKERILKLHSLGFVFAPRRKA